MSKILKTLKYLVQIILDSIIEQAVQNIIINKLPDLLEYITTIFQ